MTLGNFLGHVRRSHTAVAGGPGADAPKRTGLFGISSPGLRKDTHDHHKIAYILHCSWGQAFLIGKAKLLFRHILIGKLDVIGLKAIKC